MIPAADNDNRRWRLAATALYSGSFLTLGLTFAILGPTLPTLAQQTGASLTDISVLFVARSLGSLAGSVGGGRMLDHFAGHRVIAAAMTLMVAVTALTPLVPQLWLLALILFLSGMVHGTLNVSGNALLVWTHGKDVAPYMNALHFFFGLGSSLAPIVVAQVALLTGGIGWAYGLVAAAFLPAIAAAWVLRSPHSPEKTAAGGQAPARADPWLVLGFFMIFFGYAGTSGAHGGWLYTYATRLGLVDETGAAYLNSAFWGALMAGRLLSIPFALRFAPKTMLRLDLLGSLASLGLMTLFPHSLLAVSVGSVGLGFFQATIFPTNMSLASRHIPITGQVTGWLSIGSSLGALGLPWLVGQLFESAGPETLMGLNFVNVLITLGVFVWLTRRLEER